MLALVKKLFTDHARFLQLAALLVACDMILTVLIILRVPYTEIDWIAYMQEVGGVAGGEYDYTKLRGDTGPLVYPAGFVWIYWPLMWVTGGGADVRLAQWIFAALYLCSLVVTLDLFRVTRPGPPYLAVLLVLSKRVHSIFVLRLFNDPVENLLLLVAVRLFVARRWTTGCLFYSLAVSVKMNALLPAPALFFLLLENVGLGGTVRDLSLCAAVQVGLAVPFLLENPWGYLARAFELTRVFTHRWTVNWRFLPVSVFTDARWGLLLLALHVACVAWLLKRQFPRGMWVGENKGGDSPLASRRRIATLLFAANFVGVAFARTLHYQFYSWYFFSLPWLLGAAGWRPVAVAAWALAVEWCWNVYPSTNASSAVLQVCHAALVVALVARRAPTADDENENAGKSKSA